jgi:site-specific recombinase XerC
MNYHSAYAWSNRYPALHDSLRSARPIKRVALTGSHKNGTRWVKLCLKEGLVAYGLDRPPMPLPAIQQLLGHADISTTTIYTRVSADDLARMMGTSGAL